MILSGIKKEKKMTKPDEPPLLIADLSEFLLDLMTVDPFIVDAVEVGPWLSIEQISAYRQKLPDMPFFFHGSNLIVEIGENSGAEESIKEYLACTQSPWLSVHLSIWEEGSIDRYMHGEGLLLPDPEESLALLLRRLERLVGLVQVPVLIENIEPLPQDGYDYWSQPEYICRVLERSGCGLLLDTGHLRVSADRLGMTEDAYLAQLPLEQIVEIHVSGPRRRAGRLLDLHEPMRAPDYKLLELLLSRQAARAVTLEYIQDREKLSRQLKLLRRLPGLGSIHPDGSV
jgi:uncharacterized protein (UPF0276 family)